MNDGIKETLIRALMDSDEPVWFMSHHGTGKVVFANNAFMSWFPVGTQLPMPVSQIEGILAPSDRKNWTDAIGGLASAGASRSVVVSVGVGSTEKLVRLELGCGAAAAAGDGGVLVMATDITDAKFRNAEMDGAEYFSVLENIHDLFFALDKDGNFVFVNKALRQLLRLGDDELNGKNVWQVFPDARGLLFEEAYNRATAHMTTIEFEDFLPSLNRWLSVIIYPTPSGKSVFLQDITRRKRQSALLAQSEKRFHQMSDNSPMLIFTLNEQFEPTFFNKTLLHFAGRSSDDLMGSGWFSLIAADESLTVVGEFERCFREHKEVSLECRLHRHDGEYRWVKFNATPQLDLDGIFTGYLVNGVDISDIKYYYGKLEEKNAELELALNESRRLSGILNKTSNILVLTDVDGKITWVNEAFTRYKEYTLEEVLGKKPGPLVYGPETNPETVELLHEGIRKKEITRVEILNYTKSGKQIWVDLRIEPIVRNGMPEGYMAIEMDITQRKKDELAIKERTEKIKEFSFITSHDLRHEFAKVMMLLNLAKTKENSVEDYRELFRHLEEPINKINATISKINTNLYLGETGHTLEERLNEMEEIREICLVDDDALTNMIHKQIIKIIMPQTPIRVYDSVDSALSYFKVQPNGNRLVFLDLVFHTGQSGWEFLKEYESAGLTAPVVILSSSIDNDDLQKSKQYKSVLEYFVKPLTADTLHKYIRKK